MAKIANDPVEKNYAEMVIFNFGLTVLINADEEFKRVNMMYLFVPNSLNKLITNVCEKPAFVCGLPPVW